MAPAAVPDLPQERIYLDHAATAPLRSCARRAWLQTQELIGNPASQHTEGRQAQDTLEACRATVKQLLGPGHDVVLTSGGTEAIALAVLGSIAPDFRGSHIVVSSIEHSAVLGAAQTARRLGAQVTTVPVTSGGTVDLDALSDAVQPHTSLVCVQHANNETGVLQPVAQVRHITQKYQVRLLVDAVQTAGKLPVSHVEADLLAVSAHKFGGGRGAGALRVAPGTRLEPVVAGATHEGGLRAGTQDVPAAAAMAAAASECMADDLQPEGQQRARSARARWEQGMMSLGTLASPVTSARTLPQTLLVLAHGLRGDTVASLLDRQGISVGTGAACHGAGSRPSHVLTAMGLGPADAASAVRISFASTIPHDHIERTIRALEETMTLLHRTSGSLTPLHDQPED